MIELLDVYRIKFYLRNKIKYRFIINYSYIYIFMLFGISIIYVYCMSLSFSFCFHFIIFSSHKNRQIDNAIPYHRKRWIIIILLPCFCSKHRHENVFIRDCAYPYICTYLHDISIAHLNNHIVHPLRLTVTLCVPKQKSPQKNGSKVATAIAKTVISLTFLAIHMLYIHITIITKFLQ